MALTLQLLQHSLSVAAVTQSGVHADLARLNLKKLQNFIHHNGNVHASRSLTAFNDFLYIGLVLFRIQFLIFFPIIPGMGALIAHTALVLLFHGINSFECYHIIAHRKREVQKPGLPFRTVRVNHIIRKWGTDGTARPLPHGPERRCPRSPVPPWPSTWRS